MTQKDPTQQPHNGRVRSETSVPRPGQSDLRTSTIADAAKRTAGHLASEAKEEVASRAASTKDKAAGRLGTMASALRSTQKELGDDATMVGDYAKRAAEGVDRLSSYIQTRTLGQLVSDVEGFARREPALFFGGAFTLGLLAGRFLKSSPLEGEDEPADSPQMALPRIDTEEEP